MKSLFAVLLICIFGSHSQAQVNNSYAPTLKNVTVLYDVADNAYSPFLWHFFKAEDVVLQMKSDPTCDQVFVTQVNSRAPKVLNCSSKNGVNTAVGTINPVGVGRDGDYTIHEINWISGKVAIRTWGKPGSLAYSIQVLTK